MDTEEIGNVLHTLHNRCRIAMFLIDNASDELIEETLPTLLEDNHENAQYLSMKYCVEEG
ncbi:hypothetical protein ACFLXA_02845 [Chloroflexota bacterium]